MAPARWFGPCWGLLAAVALSDVAASQSSGKEAVVIRAGEEVSDWLLDESSGRVFASLGKRDEVVEFSSETGEEVRRWKVGQKPRQMVIKGRRLVVSVAEGSSALCVVNLESNEVEGQIALGSRNPIGLCCSKADIPLVYAFCDTASGFSQMLQVDIVNRRLRNRVSCDFWEVRDPRLATMSADGRHLLVEGEPSPTGLALMKVDEEKATFVGQIYYHDTFGSLVADPCGRYWLVNGELAPLNLLPSGPKATNLLDFHGIRRFSGLPGAIHPELDLVVSVDFYRSYSTRLVFETLGTGQRLTEVSLPLESGEGDDPSGFRSRDTRTLQFDAERRRVFCARFEQACLVDMASLNLPAKPRLVLQVPGEVSVTFGQTLKIPLVLNNPSLLPRTEFQVVSDLNEITIDDEKNLVWKPTAADVGIRRVKLTATAPECKDELELDIRVEWPTIELGALVRRMVVSREGRWAALTVRPPGQRPITDKELLLVDLQESRVAARRTLRKPLGAFHVTSRAVYVAPLGSAVFYAWSLDDLSTGGRGELPDEIRTLATPATDRLAVETASGIAVFDESTLERVGGAAESLMRESAPVATWNPNEIALASRLNEGMYFSGIVLDCETFTPQMLFRCPGIPAVGDPLLASSRHSSGRACPKLWSRQVESEGLYSNSDRIANWTSAESFLSQDFPLVLSVRQASKRNPGRGQSIAELALELRDLVQGAPSRSLTLLERPLWIPLHLAGHAAENPLITSAGTTAVVAYLDKLFVVPLTPEWLDQLPQPLRFIPKQDRLEANVGDTVTLQFRTTGGQGATTFELLSKLPGLALDPATGRLEVDTAAVWKFGRSQLETLLGEKDTDGARAQLAASQAVYRSIFGKETEELPLAVNLRLAVSDQQGHSDRFACQLVLLAGHEEIAPLLAAAGETQTLTDESGLDGPVPAQLAEVLRMVAGANERATETGDRFARLSREVTDLRSQLTRLKETRADHGRSLDAIAGRDAAVGTLLSLDETLNRQAGRLRLVLILLATLAVALLVTMALMLLRLRQRPLPRQ